MARIEIDLLEIFALQLSWDKSKRLSVIHEKYVAAPSKNDAINADLIPIFEQLSEYGDSPVLAILKANLVEVVKNSLEACANKIIVNIERGDGMITVSISDDGEGFGDRMPLGRDIVGLDLPLDSSKIDVEGSLGGMAAGLRGMADGVQLHGGSFRLEANNPCGATIVMVSPIISALSHVSFLQQLVGGNLSESVVLDMTRGSIFKKRRAKHGNVSPIKVRRYSPVTIVAKVDREEILEVDERRVRDRDVDRDRIQHDEEYAERMEAIKRVKCLDQFPEKIRYKTSPVFC